MSDVALSNEAVGLIGKVAINDLDEPTETARRCKQFLPIVNREIQAKFNWEYNLTTVDIAQVSGGSDMPGYLYKHKIPASYMKFDSIHDTIDADNPATSDSQIAVVDPIPMRIADDHIHTNFTPIRLTYNKLRGTLELPQLVQTAVVYGLAAKICQPLTRDIRLTRELREQAFAALSLAQDEANKDEVHCVPTGSAFLDARL